MQTRARLVPVVVTALVAALAGVGALTWFALAPSQDDAAGGAAKSSNGASARAAEEAREAAATAANPIEAATVREEETLVVPDGYFRVAVRRADGHSPIAGAIVRCVESSWFARELERRGDDESYVDANEIVDEMGWPETTDARGCCLVPTAPIDGPRLTISVRSGLLWALVDVEVKRLSATIDLSDADAIRVQVLGADGTPLPGVVAVFGSAGQDQRLSRRALTEGRDAIATIRGVHAFTRFFSDPVAKQWGVSVALPLRTRAFTPIELDALPKEPVIVRVPACARMAIALRGRDGQPVRRKARVKVVAYPRLERPGPGEDTRLIGPNVSTQLLTVDDGWVELPYVDVGLTLEVAAEVDRSDAGHSFLEGPDAVGERREATLDLDYGTVKFVGMLVRADDTPAAGERVELRVVGNRGAKVRRSGVLPYEEAEVGVGMTDAQGKYAILVPVVGIGPGSFDCELLVRSATGLDRKLAAIAVVAEKNGDAFMGTLHVPEN